MGGNTDLWFQVLAHHPVRPEHPPFSTTSTTASDASVQRKKPVANGDSVPS